MRDTTIQLYDAVICKNCKKIECMKCKNSKGSLNNPCSYCSGPVSPAFENLIVKSETSSHPEASMCWLCNIRPIDSVFHSNIEVPMRKTSLDFITRRTTLQTINIKIPVCIVCNLGITKILKYHIRNNDNVI